jgi:hypothetical protein
MKRNAGGRGGLKAALGAAAAALLLALVPGCETPAHRLAPKAAKAIQPGVTTRLDILRDFGTPRETTRANGRTLLFYQRQYSPPPPYGFSPSQPATLIGLSVLCGPDDRVLRAHYSSHQVDLFWGPGSVSAGTPVTEKTLAKIRPNVTTRQEAMALLGEPWMEGMTLDGGLVIDWGYWEGNRIGGARQRIFRLFFNEADVVAASQSDLHR